MNAQTAIQHQLAILHGGLSQLLPNTDPSTLNKSLPAAELGSVGAIFAHLVCSQDAFVQARFQGKPTIFESGGWAAKTGVPFVGEQSLEVARSITIDPATFQPYAQEVFAATEAYLARVPDAELDRMIPTGPMEQSIGWNIALLGLHTSSHAGEIGALLGIQGTQLG